MKQSLYGLRLQARMLFLAFFLEIPFGCIVMLACFLQTASQTPLGKAIYELPSSHFVWRLLSEQVLMPAALGAFPMTLLFLLGVLLGIVLSTRKQPVIVVDCMWTFLSGIIYAFSPVFSMIFGFLPLGILSILIFAVFHIMVGYHLWKYHKAIRQEKQRLKNSEIPTETAGE